jgi:hypothetical protein
MQSGTGIALETVTTRLQAVDGSADVARIQRYAAVLL